MKTELEIANERILELENQVKKLSLNLPVMRSLPSDGEIEKAAFERKPNSRKLDDNIARNNWIFGAQWMRALAEGNDA